MIVQIIKAKLRLKRFRCKECGTYSYRPRKLFAYSGNVDVCMSCRWAMEVFKRQPADSEKVAKSPELTG